MTRYVGVAEAKRRFSELLDRVAGGEHIVVARRGRPAVVFVPPGSEPDFATRPAPTGFASIAGSLGEWPELDDAIDDTLRTRKNAKDRPAPDLG